MILENDQKPPKIDVKNLRKKKVFKMTKECQFLDIFYGAN